jgi:hypothetical protein
MQFFVRTDKPRLTKRLKFKLNHQTRACPTRSHLTTTPRLSCSEVAMADLDKAILLIGPVMVLDPLRRSAQDLHVPDCVCSIFSFIHCSTGVRRKICPFHPFRGRIFGVEERSTPDADSLMAWKHTLFRTIDSSNVAWAW